MAKVHPYEEEGTPLSFLQTCSTEELLTEIATRCNPEACVVGYVMPNERGEPEWRLRTSGDLNGGLVLTLRLEAWLRKRLGL